MGAPIKPIKTEKEYEEALDRLTKAADEIEHPLVTEENKAIYQKAYDRIAAHIEHYKIRRSAREFPNVRGLYEILGWIGKDEVL
jgi:antitoxin component HigA of HigAB toxin-antitoxin module